MIDSTLHLYFFCCIGSTLTQATCASSRLHQIKYDWFKQKSLWKLIFFVIKGIKSTLVLLLEKTTRKRPMLSRLSLWSMMITCLLGYCFITESSQQPAHVKYLKISNIISAAFVLTFLVNYTSHRIKKVFCARVVVSTSDQWRKPTAYDDKW